MTKTKKKYLVLAVMIIMTAFAFFYYYSSNSSIPVTVQEPFEEAETYKRQQNEFTNKTVDEKRVDNIQSNHDYKYDLSEKCGFDIEKYYEEVSQFETNSHVEKEISHLEKLMADCDVWFDELSNLSDTELKKIKITNKKKYELLSELSAYEYQKSTINKAMNMVSHADPDIAGTALLYLLSFDNGFLIKIGEKMGVSNVEFLQANLHLAGLFGCQQGMDCSATGALMTDLCYINEGSCGLSYEASLMRQITNNQYDDLLHALQVINLIFSSDWFEDRDILNPTDP